MRVLADPMFANRAANPYNWLLYTEMKRQGVEVHEFGAGPPQGVAFDVLHVHWPNYFFFSHAQSQTPDLARARARLAVVDALRAAGTKVVWTVHNVAPHDAQAKAQQDWLVSEFVPRLDLVIHLAKSGAIDAKRAIAHLANVPARVIPHGHYRGVYPNARRREETRRLLNIPEKADVLAFFGQVRRYKGIEDLVSAFQKIRGDEVSLVIAGGATDEAYAAQLSELARKDRRIRAVLRRIPDAEVEVVLDSADLVVLPYRKILNSGAAILALSFDRPVLVPKMGAMPELQHTVGHEWVELYDGDIDDRILTKALKHAKKRPAGAKPNLDAMAWDKVAEQTIDAFRSVLPSAP